MPKKIKKKWWRLSVLAVAAILLFFWIRGRAPQPEYTTAAVTRGELVQTVSETGTVKPVKRLDLNFPQAGLISQISVKVGDRVAKDQVLAELDQSSLLIRQQEAQASLAAAMASRTKLVSGATPAEIAVLAAQVSQAKTAYEGATSDYDKTRKTAVENVAQAEKKLNDLKDGTDATPTALEQAVAIAKLNQTSGLANYRQALSNSENVFSNAAEYNMALASTALDKIRGLLDDDSLDNIFSARNTAYRAQSETLYEQAKDLKTAAASALNTAKSLQNEAAYNALNSALSGYLSKVFSNLNAVYSGLENTVTSSSFPQSSLDAYKASINGQITAINGGINSQQTAKSSLDSAFLSYKNNTASLAEAVRQAEINLSEERLAAENALATTKLASDKQVAASKSAMDAAKENWGVADRQLAKLRAGARSEDLSLADAQIRQAQASLDLINKQMEDSQLKAPIDGQITGVNYEAGEQYSAAQPVFTMLTENNFEVDVDISETDIAKVTVGDAAEITFDALGEGRKFGGTVFSVDPGATVIQGVIYYKAKIALATDQDGQDISSLIKPEMTANVIIQTARKEDILIVPSRAVIEREGGSQIVRILENGSVREVPVKLGLNGDDGLVEVTEGNLQPGQQAITFVKEPGQ